MITQDTTRARHRADLRPKTFLSDLPCSAVARRGSLGLAVSGMAFGLVAPTASAYDPGSSTEPAATTSTSSSGSGTYTVQAGDTVATIAQSQGASVSAIVAANGLGASALVYPGDVLSLSGGSGSNSSGSSSAASNESAESTADSASRSDERSSTQQASSSGSGTYTVQAGDTVATIAQSQGSSVSAIVAANGLGASALIYPGDVLSLSGGSGSNSDVSNSDASNSDASNSGASSESSSSESSSSESSSSESNSAASNESAESTADSASRSDERSSTQQASSSSSTQQASSSSSTQEPTIQQASTSSNGLLDIARQHVGTPYVHGGATPGAFDCSGFVQYVFAQAGIDLPRTTSAQAAAGYQVSASEARPGDLVWSPGHIGIYTGNGNHIAARSPGTALHESPIYMSNPTFIRVS